MKLSIVTLSYQNPEQLSRTLQSLSPLLNLKGLEWEHLIMDSSPELNQAVIAKIPKAWPLKVRVVPAQGIYHAMNTALQEVTGEILWFLHSGDLLLDLRALTEDIEAFDADPHLSVVISGHVRANIGGHWRVPAFPDTWHALLGTCRICQQSVLYRREVFSRLGPFTTDLKIAGDYEHFWKIMIEKISVRPMPNFLATFDSNGTSSHWKNALEEFRLVHKKYWTRLNRVQKVRNEVIYYRTLLKMHLIEGLKKAGIYFWIRRLGVALQRKWG